LTSITNDLTCFVRSLMQSLSSSSFLSLILSCALFKGDVTMRCMQRHVWWMQVFWCDVDLMDKNRCACTIFRT
jgi:hypothetical protein